MINNQRLKLQLAKSFLFEIGILVFFFWLNAGTDMQRMVNEYSLITGQKAMVTGQIIRAEEFAEEAEENDGRTVDLAHGYAYTYKFQPESGQEIHVTNRSYGELPFDFSLEDIPYEVEIEYVANNPNSNRIKDLEGNDNTLFQWFRHQVALKLLGLLFCVYLAYKLIKSGIRRYKQEMQIAG